MKIIRPLIVFLVLLYLTAACTSTPKETQPPAQSTDIPAPTDVQHQEPNPTVVPTLPPTEEPAEEPAPASEALITDISQMIRIEAAIFGGYHLNWSPDGEWIAFTVNDEGAYGIGMVNMLTDEFFMLNADMEGDLYNSWSADGSRLVVDQRINDGPLQLVEIELPEDLNAPIKMEPLAIEGFSMSPSFAPVGDQLVYSSHEGLAIYDFTAQSSTAIPGTQGCWHPQWSPIGDSILFTCETENGSAIFSSGLDGSDRQQLTDQPGRADRGAWSPDGEWVIFVSDTTGARQLWLVSTVSGENIQLTDLPTNADTWLYPSMPIFSPDGSQFALTYDGALWLIDINL